MLDLNKELESLISKHQIYRLKGNCTRQFLFNQSRNDLCIDLVDCGSAEDCFIFNVLRSLNKMIENLPDNAVIAIRGAGPHTAHLLPLITNENKERIKFLIDKDASSVQNLGIPCIDVCEVSSVHIDYFIISSYVYKDEMKKELLEAGYAASSVIDIYEHFKKDGIIFGFLFYIDERIRDCGLYRNYVGIKSKYCLYKWGYLISLRQQYMIACHLENDSLIQDTLYNLIIGYLSLRDFINLRKYIDIYVASNYEGFEVFINFLINLDDLFEKVKTALRDISGNNILTFLFDQLEAPFIDYMPYTKKLKENAIIFENAYSQTNYTTSSMQCVFSGKDLIEEKSYEIKSFNYSNSPLLKTLKENNYKCHFLLPFDKYHLFEEVNENKKNIPYTIPEILWDLLCLLSKSKGNNYYHVHIHETHDSHPHGLSDMYVASKQWSHLSDDAKVLNLLKCLKYLDSQFEFYGKMIPDNITRIIMSDHCSTRIKNKIINFNDIKALPSKGTKITLFIYNKCIPNTKSFDDIFSLTNFNKLIAYLLKNEGEISMFDGYAKIQLIPWYDKSILDFMVEAHGTRGLVMPLKGIITLKGIYTIDYDGVESYYTYTDENVIESLEYQQEIEMARKLCDKNFHDIFEQPKFAYAKEVYTKHGLIKG